MSAEIHQNIIELPGGLTARNTEETRRDYRAAEKRKRRFEWKPLKERFTLPQTDCLVIPGHSIGKDKEGNWKLTELLQPVTEKGVAPDGFRKFQRTARIEPIPSDDPHAIVGGGEFTITSAVLMINMLSERGKAPKAVIHCGGRPGYLDAALKEDSSLSEAKIMESTMSAKLGQQASDVKQVKVETTKNTEDDIREGLKQALANDCKAVTFLAMDIRLARCREFFEKVTEQDPQLSGIEVNFISAEEVTRYVLREQGKSTYELDKILDAYERSLAYSRTWEAEHGGIKAGRARIYGKSMGGVGNT